MTIVKYCSKNDKQGTKHVYEEMKRQCPELTQQRKGCLGECKLCRRQPFVLIDKKQIVRAKSPEQLVQKLRARLVPASGAPDNDNTASSQPTVAKGQKSKDQSSPPPVEVVMYHFGAEGKKELYLLFQPAAAQRMIERMQALLQSGKRQKLKAMRIKKSDTIDARIIMTHTEADNSQLDTGKKRLFLELTDADLHEAIARLQHYVQTGELNDEPYGQFARSGGKKSVQVYLVPLEAAASKTTEQESIV